ncbi:MAG: glycosyltransferase family 39 protein [Flavobacteriales bacterium]
MNGKLLIAIIILGALLRINGMSREGMWNDELSTMQVASGQRYVVLDTISVFTNVQLAATDDLPGVVESTINDNGNSLLYNVLLHYWLALFGRGNFAARFIPLLAGICIILVSFFFSRTLIASTKAALGASAFVALHPLLIGQSHECRAYSLALLFSLLSSLFLLKGMTKRTALFFALHAITATAALLCHYLTVYVLFAQVVVILIWCQGRSKKIAFGISALAISLAMGTWYWNGGKQGAIILADQSREHRLEAAAYTPGDPPFALPVTVANIGTGLAQAELQIFGNPIQNKGLRVRYASFFLVIPVILLVGLFRYLRKSDKDRKMPFFILLTFVGVQAWFAVAAAVRAGHCLSFLPQYAVFVVPYAMVLLGWSVAIVFKSSSRAKIITLSAVALYVMFCVVGIAVTYSDPFEKFPERNISLDAAQSIEATWQPGDTVLIRTRMEARSINVYLSKEKCVLQKIEPGLPVMYTISGPD